MKKSVFKNRMSQLFNNEKARTICANGGGNKAAKSLVLAVGDKLTMHISDTTTIEDIANADKYGDNDYTNIHFEECDIALSKLARRGNGLRLKGADQWEMLEDFVGRAVANGGTYTIEVDEIRQQVFNDSGVSNYYKFKVVSNEIPELEEDVDENA